jgi:hypothetical protein
LPSVLGDVEDIGLHDIEVGQDHIAWRLENVANRIPLQVVPQRDKESSRDRLMFDDQ